MALGSEIVERDLWIALDDLRKLGKLEKYGIAGKMFTILVEEKENKIKEWV
ncbi:19761_t:CDS:2 [Cetraspora pellucida]|uniref:19761_t:CDS:1 n=1 Tax=Cetraspora pellucida TaxID=1433469 RepID=A0A9N9GZL0_9GLOM|nr:19761_t:CDS:2 [Cetraspora pellucida]